jgi:glycosyltransferase involved in cell wall biosynthesis
LPPLAHVYQKGCLIAKKNNTVDFAEKVLEILQDKKLYNKLQKEALVAAKLWEWKYKGKQFLSFLSDNI